MSDFNSAPKTCLVLDFDNTLVFTEHALDEAMDAWLSQAFDLPLKAATRHRKEYYEEFATDIYGSCNALLGFKRDHAKDAAWFDRALDEIVVNMVPFVKALQPPLGHLVAQLQALHDQGVVLAVLSHNYATAIVPLLEHYGLDRLIPPAMVFDKKRVGGSNKRTTAPYLFVQESLRAENISRYIMVEDSPANLPPAKQLGWHTILVGNEPPHDDHHPAIDATFATLEEALADLLTGKLKSFVS